MFERLIAVGFTDGGDQQGEITGAIGEDAEVAVDDFPDNVQAVTPGVDLGKV